MDTSQHQDQVLALLQGHDPEGAELLISMRSEDPDAFLAALCGSLVEENGRAVAAGSARAQIQALDEMTRDLMRLNI